jgi:hypothetical protein
MQAFEFTANLNSDHQIQIPENVNRFFSKKEKVRVIILKDSDDSDEDWKGQTAKNFIDGYSIEDSIYDKL